MKKRFTFAAVALCAAALGCEKTPAQKQAETVRESSNMAADDVKEEGDAKAAAVRDQSEKTVVGTAKDPVVEEHADAIEADAKARSKEIKKAGEAEADRIEDAAK